MKIVEQQMMDAVVKKHSVRLGTTCVVYESGVSKVYFYGTQIAEVEREIKMREQVYGRMNFPNATFKRSA